jgi:hypothetical protein
MLRHRRPSLPSLLAAALALASASSDAAAGDYYVLRADDEALTLLDIDSVNPGAETRTVTTPAILAVPESVGCSTSPRDGGRDRRQLRRR